MKKQFTADVVKLGGTTAYSGGTPKPVMSERTQHTKQLKTWKEFRGKKHLTRVLILGYYAAKKLIEMGPRRTPTMYVKGLNEEAAMKLQSLYKGIKLPFMVEFQ